MNSSISGFQTARIFFHITKLKLLDFIRFDSKIGATGLFVFYFIRYHIVRITKGEIAALIQAGNIFRQVQFQWARNFSTAILLRSLKKYGERKTGMAIMNIVEKKIQPDTISRLKESIVNGEERPFNQRLLLLAEPTGDSKGVLLVKFTNFFKYIPYIFDIEKLKKEYILVVEPSYGGYFDEDILCLLNTDIPVVIETPEPVDFDFISSLQSNLYPVDIGANCWVNKEAFFLIEGTEKIYDVVMIAIWADFKRHFHLFEALKRCKKEIKIALIGRPWPRTLEEIKKQAQYYGVDSKIDFFEDLSHQEINVIINKSKTLLLLSKREGINKALIESMYANTPVFLLEGFNMGYKYPYINSHTGQFIKGTKLSAFLNNIDAILSNCSFTPRDWIINNLSPEESVKKISHVLGKIECAQNIKINKSIFIKTNSPELDYLDKTLWHTLKERYINLKTYFKE